MLDRLLWRDALLRIESHHLIHQVYRAFARIGYQLAKRRGHELGEGEADLGRELVTFGPLCLRWTAQHGARLIDLVRLIVAWEERSH